MADINKLMQIINALEAQGMDVEGMLGGLLAPAPYPAVGIRDDGMPPPVPMPQPMPRQDGMPPPAQMGRPLTQEEMLAEIKRRRMGMDQAPGVGSVSQGDIDMMMNRMPQMQPGMGGISQREMDMMLRRMPGQGQSRSGILELLQRMR